MKTILCFPKYSYNPGKLYIGISLEEKMKEEFKEYA